MEYCLFGFDFVFLEDYILLDIMYFVIGFIFFKILDIVF